MAGPSMRSWPLGLALAAAVTAGAALGGDSEEGFPGAKPVEVNRSTRLAEEALARALGQGGAPEAGSGVALSGFLHEARLRSQASADALQWLADHWPG